MATKQVTRRQLAEDARRAALDGNWEDAVKLNEQIITQSDRDTIAYNRLGRAYIALGQLNEAKDAYTKALHTDPANLIARRNLQRLELMRGPGGKFTAEVSRPGAMPRTSVFLEEVGRTWVDELVNPGEMLILADISSGEQLVLSEEDGRLIARRANGDLLGEVEPKTGRRVLDLMDQGNRYEIFALGLAGQTLRIILREIHRDPALATTVSFPRQITSRAYLRDRDLLRQRDESDFFLLDEDEEEDDTETAATETDDEDSGESDSDSEPFVDSVAEMEEEDSSM
ncbi:MAG: tetratricopeptide repeat protein [Chloroflexota bacterium]|nr:tetratricopeptide repeat protein [Chloroflexota bacterium]